VAPYVRQTHIKDAALRLQPDGVLYQERTVGRGAIDLRAIVARLHAANPAVNLTIENAQPWNDVALTYPTFRTELIPLRGCALVEVFDGDWLAAHPDMSVPELAAYLALAQRCGELVADGTLPTFEACTPETFGFAEAVGAVKESAAHLRALVAELGTDA
jgi:hypothetical protein